MLTTKQRRPAIRTLRGWATNVLTEAGAVRECEEHGWMQDRTDPHARNHAVMLRRLASLRMRRRPKFKMSWKQSGTAAQSARPPISPMLVSEVIWAPVNA
jgi:hypothetical protein